MNDQAGKAILCSAYYRRPDSYRDSSYLFGGHVAERGAFLMAFFINLLKINHIMFSKLRILEQNEKVLQQNENIQQQDENILSQHENITLQYANTQPRNENILPQKENMPRQNEKIKQQHENKKS